MVDLIHVAKPSRLKNANSDIFQSCKIVCTRIFWQYCHFFLVLDSIRLVFKFNLYFYSKYDSQTTSKKLHLFGNILKSHYLCISLCIQGKPSPYRHKNITGKAKVDDADMSRNESVSLSNGWIKTQLWMFLPRFLYTVISIVYFVAS